MALSPKVFVAALGPGLALLRGHLAWVQGCLACGTEWSSSWRRVLSTQHALGLTDLVSSSSSELVGARMHDVFWMALFINLHIVDVGNHFLPQCV